MKEILSSEDAGFGEFTIVETTADERAALAQGGYSLADWTPDPASACAACHGGECEKAGQCRELQDEKEEARPGPTRQPVFHIRGRRF